MDCLQFKAIPKLSCKDAILDADGFYVENALSILRVIRNLSTSLDTTSLSTEYGFQADGTKADITGIAPTTDLTLMWIPSAVNLSTSSDDVDISKGCITGDDVTPDSEVKYYISYYYAARTAARTAKGIRNWISRPLLCGSATGGDSESSAALRGPVSFANPRVGGHGMPPFIPRSGGGGDEEGDQDDCTPDSVKVKVFNNTENAIKAYTPVIFTGYRTADDIRGCAPWNAEMSGYPWGVLLPGDDPDNPSLPPGDDPDNPSLPPATATGIDKDDPSLVAIKDDDVTGCCVILGVVTIPEYRIQTKKNGLVLAGNKITPIPPVDDPADTNDKTKTKYYKISSVGQAMRIAAGGDYTVILDRTGTSGVNLQLAQYLGYTITESDTGKVLKTHKYKLLSLGCDGKLVPGEIITIVEELEYV